MTRDEALVATAKAVAVPVVRWVAEREPLDYLLAGRTWRELAAVITVLAEVVANCEDGDQVLAEVTGVIEGRGHRGQARWSRPDDGILDEVAVILAADGKRELPLSPPERLRAAQRIIAAGGGAGLIEKRLHVNGSGAKALADEAREALAEAAGAGGQEVAA